MEAPIQIRHLTKRYDSFTLDDVSFDVPAGTILGLVGENGAGKTTTIRLLLHLAFPDGGETLLFGDGSPRAALHEDIGVVFDECCFHEQLYPQNLDRILAGLYHQWDSALFQTYCARFGLPAKKKIKDLSRGMKRKLSIAAALSHHPKLLILDEATSGLDPVVRSEMLDLLLEFIQDETHAVLLSSHITSDLEHVADYIAYLHEGRLLFCESKDELLNRCGIIRCGADALAKLDPADVISYRRNEFGCAALTGNRAAAKEKYRALVVDRASIEDIMVFYGKGERL